MTKLLASSRYLIIIAVIGSFLAGTALLVFGGIATVETIIKALNPLKFEEKVLKDLSLAFIQLVDIFLIATAMYVIALGLYELFIDEKIVLPEWLEIHHLDDLKDKLLGVIVVVMAVFFLRELVSWDGQTNLLIPGGSIALIVASLTYFLSNKPKHPKE